jgi:beta-xylosidase
VWSGDFPDPFVLRAGATYYAFSTESGLQQVPVLKSVDLKTWQPVGDALPRLPSWSSPGFVWGPAVLARGGTFLLFYATQVAANGRQCISEAISVLPQGPYADVSSGPLVCQLDRGGSIDPNPFVAADGSAWLIWKSEGTTAGEPTRIWSQPLNSDGRALAGQPTELLHTELPWEQPIIEGPAMWLAPDGHLILFYSANRWQTASYAIGWASCTSPAGPCQRGTSQPWLSTAGARAGPGGPSVFSDIAGRTYLAFHAWHAPFVGYPQGARRFYIVGLSVVAGAPVIANAP